MLNKSQEELFSNFYKSTINNNYLDDRTAILIGLAASMAVACYPCMKYYLTEAKEIGIKKEEIGEVLAKVMAVSAGRVNVQLEDVISNYFEKDEDSG